MLIVSLESLTKTNSCILRASDPVSLSTFWLISEISLCVAAGLDVSHLTRAAVNLACRYVSGLIYQPPLLSRSPPPHLFPFSPHLSSLFCFSARAFVTLPVVLPYLQSDSLSQNPGRQVMGILIPAPAGRLEETSVWFLCVVRVCNLCNSFTKKQRSERKQICHFKWGHLNTLIHSFSPSVR